jgi:ribosome-associated translation inhibitor RaiA
MAAGPELTCPAEPTRLHQEEANGQFRSACTIRIKGGHLLEASGDGPDAYAAVEHLEKPVRRHKRRLKSHDNDCHAAAFEGISARDCTVDLGAGGGYDGWDCSTSPDKSTAEHTSIVAVTGHGTRE